MVKILFGNFEGCLRQGKLSDTKTWTYVPHTQNIFPDAYGTLNNLKIHIFKKSNYDNTSLH